MEGFLASLYPWTLAFHVIAMVAWMAGIFYLPRLFVYHAEKVEAGSETDALFQTMERRLLYAIMKPAMVATWIFGFCLVLTPGLVDWSSLWPWAKAVGVVAMTFFHYWLGERRRDFAAGRNRLPGRAYRIANEAPTLLLVLIVVSVIVKF